ncbi:hypothetical protein HQ531_03580 [bacterium]|nr:hypothetical protein [bacterium]
MRFRLNNDLSRIVFSNHNKFHFFVSMVIAFVVGLWTGSARLGFFAGYGVFLLWEIYNGFSPWYEDFEYNTFQPHWWNWVKENLWYSDGFSYQDVFVWNLSGALIGAGLISLIL